MYRILYALVMAVLFTLAIHFSPVSGQENRKCKEWIGSFTNGDLITNEILNTILLDHKKWLQSNIGGVKAKLSGSNLREANLSESNLTGANLTRAKPHCCKRRSK